MAYTRINWLDSPSVMTPINAFNLNIMDAQIKASDDSIVGISTNRKLDETGNFTGTLNGMPIVQDVTGLPTTVAYHTAQLTEITAQTGHYKTLSKMQNNQVSYIIATGDSVTFSVQPHPSSLPVANPYPALLQTKLRQIYNNNNITVENQGISGYSSGSWLSGTTYNDLVLSKNPDMIILMLGINDIQSGINSATYEVNMTQLITKALDKGIEVILMTEPMIMVKNDWVAAGTYQDVNSLNYAYSKICHKLAEKYHISLIDLQQEFIDLFYKSNAYLPSDLINTTDFVHPTVQGYEIISEIVVKNFQNVPVMIIDNPKNVNAVGCPFIESNMQIAKTTGGNGLRFHETYILYTGDYIKFRFLVLQNNLSLNILKGIAYNGGNVDVTLDGTLLKTLNSNDANLATDGTTIKYNVKEWLTDLTIGYHELTFNNVTQVGVSSTFYFLLQAFIFEFNEPRSVIKNKMVTLANGTFVPVNTDLVNDLVCLKTGKKLVINLKGYFQNSVGLLIFQAIHLAGTSDSVTNFVEFLSGKIQLVTYTINSTIIATTIGTNILDLTKELDVRIEIDSSYNFNVYVNNILELTVANSGNSIKGGLLKLLNQSGSTVNTMISNLSWCYY